MSEDLWKKVDDYIAEALIPSDSALEAALESSQAAALPSIQVSAAQGKLLHLLAKTCGAKQILEIGTLGGYSTIWLARALPPGGRLVTLELDPKHAEVAQANVSRAGVGDRVEIRVGHALDLLPRLASENRPEFDLVFIDADKISAADYFDWALRLSRIGSIIIVDNVVRNGLLADGSSEDPNVKGMRRLHEVLATEQRVSATTIQTVGSKGYDGFTYAVVLEKDGAHSSPS
jgi:predicted O-methyltransferase YrrM